MNYFSKLRHIILGPPRNPMNPNARRSVALIAFFAWVGLGSDGLSSSCYGPAESFLALGSHYHLGLYLVLAIALTVFIISFSYNQVIELFPNGGGGYKVATELVSPVAGVVSGAALIIDYVLTITISIASAADALFSLMPVHLLHYKMGFEIFLILLLMTLNLRGMKESIKVLIPIFIGFVVTHFFLILYGIIHHAHRFPALVHTTLRETHQVAGDLGWVFVIVMFLRAYSLGGGTYTGIEAVSNNVNTLAEPRVRTGKWTMFYMALSLSFTAGGIMLLYLLWQVSPVHGQTLNAVVFAKMFGHWQYAHAALIVVLALEAGLLFVGANTGFLGGPAVLSNMALDSWVPNRFRVLSSRLVTQNGIILFGVASLLILLWSHGSVAYLVVLYSIDVFLTFSISLLGLCKYWLLNRHQHRNWRRRFCLSAVGFLICACILMITLITKFTTGGWFTLVITGGVITLCAVIRRHYRHTDKMLKAVDDIFAAPTSNGKSDDVPALDPSASTAVFFVGKSRGATVHTILWAQRLFPDQFKNFVFVSVGVVDVENFSRDNIIDKMQTEIDDDLQYMTQFCPSKPYSQPNATATLAQILSKNSMS